MNADKFFHPEKYAHVETERRFLVGSLPPEVLSGSFVRIIDHYLTGTRLRLRRIESPDGTTLIRKLGQKYRSDEQDARYTMMTTIYLNAHEYEVLSVLDGATLVKRRYDYHQAGVDYSIDVFEGDLHGLILLESEGRGADDISTIPVPPFAAREVTDEVAFNGGALAKLSAEEYRQWLASVSG